MPCRKLTASLEIQLVSFLYNSDKVIKIKIHSVQKQTKSVDCGVCALAFMTECCFNRYIGDTPLQFDITLLRQHLAKCLEDRKFQPFTKTSLKRLLRRNKTIQVVEIINDV